MAASRNKPFNDLPAHVAAFIAARAPIAARLCVGLSGGRDSVVLLHLLIAAGLRARLSALHVHHGLSPNADAWAAHCHQLCDTWGIPLQIRKVKVAFDTGTGIEASARDARYACFAEADAEYLLLAHHQDDQAETVLFNLLRGSGVTGAKGMRDERLVGSKRLLRPLLTVAAAEIAAYAAEHGLRWIEDESNADTGLSRNYLRHEIMPRLEARFPACAAQLAKAGEHFAEAEALLGELAAFDWAGCAEGDALRVPYLRQLSASRLGNLLRWHLQRLNWRAPASARLSEFVRQLLEAGPEGRPQLELPDGELLVRRGRLEFTPHS